MNALKKFLLPALVLAFVLICAACSAGLHQPDPLPGETVLGSTKAAHSLTRTHDRKVIYDPNFNHWYIFWLRNDGKPNINRNEEGVVYQVSKDGLNWSRPVVIEPFQRSGITGWDVISVGTRLYLLGGLTNYPYTSGPSNCSIRELKIQEDGSLTVNTPLIVHDNSGGGDTSIHFYGSLLHDSEGYFWIAARVGDSTPGTHAAVIRSTKPGSIAAWGATGCIGRLCNSEWRNPYAESGRSLYQGTIAPRLLDLGPYGVGLVTFNKNDAGARRNPCGQILFVRNPSRAHDGWEPTNIVLTDRANQYAKFNVDKSRLDDRRFAAVVDPHTNIIHVAYITADTSTPESANLRYFTLSPPYRLENKSIETTVINKEVDGVNLSIDTRMTPSILYLFYVANKHPDYQLKMIRKTETGWSSALNISNDVGTVRYPQPPEKVLNDEIVVGYQYSEKQPEGWYLYHIAVRKIDPLPKAGAVK